jgi:hypothetical protein
VPESRVRISSRAVLSAQPPLPTHELLPLDPHSATLEALGAALSAVRWVGSKLHDVFVPKLERSCAQLLVGVVIEALVASKVNHLTDGHGQLHAGARALVGALEQLGGSLPTCDEKRLERELAPLRSLLTLATCDARDFGAEFGRVRARYADAGHVFAEAVLLRRGVSKAEAKATADACVPTGEDSGRNSNAALSGWVPPELAPLGGAPFSLATSRVRSNAAGWGMMRGLLKKK